MTTSLNSTELKETESLSYVETKASYDLTMWVQTSAFLDLRLQLNYSMGLMMFAVRRLMAMAYLGQAAASNDCVNAAASVPDGGAIIQFPDDLNGALVTDDLTVDEDCHVAKARAEKFCEAHLDDYPTVSMLRITGCLAQVQTHFQKTTVMCLLLSQLMLGKFAHPSKLLRVDGVPLELAETVMNLMLVARKMLPVAVRQSPLTRDGSLADARKGLVLDDPQKTESASAT